MQGSSEWFRFVRNLFYLSQISTSAIVCVNQLVIVVLVIFNCLQSLFLTLKESNYFVTKKSPKGVPNIRYLNTNVEGQ